MSGATQLRLIVGHLEKIRLELFCPDRAYSDLSALTVLADQRDEDVEG